MLLVSSLVPVCLLHSQVLVETQQIEKDLAFWVGNFPLAPTVSPPL